MGSKARDTFCVRAASSTTADAGADLVVGRPSFFWDAVALARAFVLLLPGRKAARVSRTPAGDDREAPMVCVVCRARPPLTAARCVGGTRLQNKNDPV